MCSASACEHCWSIEGWIHSQRRNRLDQKLVEKLVRTHTNLVLRESLDDTLRDLLPWNIEMSETDIKTRGMEGGRESEWEQHRERFQHECRNTVLNCGIKFTPSSLLVSQGMISTLICWFDYQNQDFQACFLKYHWFVIIKVRKQSDYHRTW